MAGPLVLLRDLKPQVDDPRTRDLDWYVGQGGYQTAETVLKTKTPDDVIAEVKASGIRGRGGAGFPTGMKWSFVPKGDGPKYLLCNADEGEPGTFKDRLLLTQHPHQLIEGMIIAGFAIGARHGYVYIRGEFVIEADIVRRAIAQAYEKKLLGKNLFGTGVDFDLHVYRGAGAYICGEETSLIESIEGKRGYPRLKPPFPAVYGAWGKPTVVNNVETLSAVPWILAKGGAEYAKIGTAKSAGTRLFSVSGHVSRPGVYEIPLGTPFQTILNDVCGGVSGGRKLKALITGGSSVPILTAAETEDLVFDFESPASKGTMLGSGGVIVMAEGTCMVRALMVLMRFYAHESCGQCTPCRDGTPWLANLTKMIETGKATMNELELLMSVSKKMAGNTICPLADAAVMPAQSYATKFRDEFIAHLDGKGCPFPAWTFGEGH